MENSRLRVILLVGIFVLSSAACALAKSKRQQASHIREYYIAAEPVEWDYAPSGLELMHGEDVPYPWGLHRHWTKTRYTAYTDRSFSQRKEQPEWLGILGPVIRAEVGDTVVVHFRNLTRGYHSIHV